MSKVEELEDDPSEEPVDPKDRQFLKDLCRHVVAIVGKAELLNSEGKVVKDKEYAVSGTVVATDDGQWYVLIAGHSVVKHIEAAKNPLHRLTPGVLSFGFGTGAKTAHPFSFSIPGRPRVDIYDKSQQLDYALYPLSPSEKACLKENNIEAFALNMTPESRNVEFTTFFGVGFPRSATLPEFDADYNIVGAKIRPDAFHLQRQPDDSSSSRKWFKAKVSDVSKVRSYVGVSGGPIIGFYTQDGKVRGQLLAIQSWWDEVEIVYGCLIDEISKHAADKLAACVAKLPSV